MKNYTSKKPSNMKANAYEYMARRQNANYERFMQEKADVFQVAETKAQALFWAMN